jgi:hypothetical protein
MITVSIPRSKTHKEGNYMQFRVNLLKGEYCFSFKRDFCGVSTHCICQYFNPKKKRWIIKYRSEAICPVERPFDIWYGRKLALSKLVRENFSKEEGTFIWQMYFTHIATSLFEDFKKEFGLQHMQLPNAMKRLKTLQRYTKLWEYRINPCKVLRKRFPKLKKRVKFPKKKAERIR